MNALDKSDEQFWLESLQFWVNAAQTNIKKTGHIHFATMGHLNNAMRELNKEKAEQNNN